MTDKEIFDNIKAERTKTKFKLKALRYMKRDIDMKLRYHIGEQNINEDNTANLLAQMRAIESQEAKIRQNKNNSQAYKFTTNAY